jgi:hypothetical protein
MAVGVAGPDDDRLRVRAVGEPAAEAGVNTDVDEHPVRAQHPGGLVQHCGVGGHVGVRHHRDDGGQGPVAQGESLGAGHGDGRPSPYGLVRD